MSKYLIINAEAIQQRIEELEKEYILLSNKSDRSLSDIEEEREIVGEQKALARILSQSTPLIPEIEKAVLEGVNSIHFENDGSHWREDDVVETYIANLKLDI